MSAAVAAKVAARQLVVALVVFDVKVVDAPVASAEAPAVVVAADFVVAAAARQAVRRMRMAPRFAA